MSWDLACRTKSKGGVGIRRLEDISKATSIKLVWNFLQGESLWAKWMHDKHRANKNFCVIQCDNNASNSWKILLKVR